MAGYMTQCTPGDAVWVVYNEYRGGPYRCKLMTIAAVCRHTATDKNGNPQAKIEYMFGDLWKSVPAKYCFPREDVDKMNAKRKH